MATFSAQNFRQSVGNYAPNSLAARPTRVPGAGTNPPMRPLPTAAPAPARLVMPARPAMSPAPQAARPASRPSGFRPPTPTAAPMTPQYDPLGTLRGANGEELPPLGAPLDLADGRQRPNEIPVGPLNSGVPDWLGSPMNTPLPFGGAYARGGIAPAGAVSMVGEQGPELIVPTGPTQVIPLSQRGTRPIGRSANDPMRIAEQQRRMGNPDMLLRMAMLDRRFGNDPRPAPAMSAPMPMPMLPPQPKGRWVAGRSAGSQVFVPDAPPAMSSTPALPAASAAPALPLAETAPAPSPAKPVNPFLMDPLGNFVNPQAAMVPNGFNAMNERLASDPAGFPGLPMPPPGLYGKEAAPLVSSMPIPGTDSVMPMVMGQPKGTALAKTAPPKPAEAPKIPEGIQYEKDALGKIIGGVYPTYNEQGRLVMRRIDLDGDGVVTPQEQAAAQAAAGTTTGGFKFSLVQ